LDTNLTPELVEEGFVYEVISKIQTMRKDADFEVMDHILVTISGNEKIAAIVEKNKEAIGAKVLADAIVMDQQAAISKEWNVNGENVTIGVEKK
jgi:isoleucyl-tRNA synthetase